ncbi:hypothetical protein PF010_g15150 [Phytophthora fragariae]|uniref:Uncharacterized protein n=1 Tax=Phytophthora fragariae TaxID=53985 RepID=A0A6A3K1K5_9STRA|nr:hypothetical protein PF011_g14586 [Phytophthora fragariae]KAE9099562.1 hypothetical protein PF010_g15150 [Phytophthora fragariae]KAE9215776.1 hypothetical protein PF004_g14645 [Phytophthora fragariae]KAE9332043.1 hypothetical protein PF008_g15129 [Phytophthora fragariae]
MADNTNTKTPFTFSFFDAAHTDGYVAPANGSKKGSSRSNNQVTSHTGGFFLDDEEDEDIATKIHHWKRTSSTVDSKVKHPQKRREVHDLFSDPVEKKPESNDTIPTPSDDIQLNRLMDDYMLGEKGDRIMQQMEALAMDDKPLTERDTKSRPENLYRDMKLEPEKQEPSLDLDAMLLMEDFEKYIAEN